VCRREQVADPHDERLRRARACPFDSVCQNLRALIVRRPPLHEPGVKIDDPEFCTRPLIAGRLTKRS
jgi:hypothetical protein